MIDFNNLRTNGIAQVASGSVDKARQDIKAMRDAKQQANMDARKMAMDEQSHMLDVQQAQTEIAQLNQQIYHQQQEFAKKDFADTIATVGSTENFSTGNLRRLNNNFARSPGDSRNMWIMNKEMLRQLNSNILNNGKGNQIIDYDIYKNSDEALIVTKDEGSGDYLVSYRSSFLTTAGAGNQYYQENQRAKKESDADVNRQNVQSAYKELQSVGLQLEIAHKTNNAQKIADLEQKKLMLENTILGTKNEGYKLDNKQKIQETFNKKQEGIALALKNENYPKMAELLREAQELANKDAGLNNDKAFFEVAIKALDAGNHQRVIELWNAREEQKLQQDKYNNNILGIKSNAQQEFTDQELDKGAAETSIAKDEAKQSAVDTQYYGDFKEADLKDKNLDIETKEILNFTNGVKAMFEQKKQSIGLQKLTADLDKIKLGNEAQGLRNIMLNLDAEYYPDLKDDEREKLRAEIRMLNLNGEYRNQEVYMKAIDAELYRDFKNLDRSKLKSDIAGIDLRNQAQAIKNIMLDIDRGNYGELSSLEIQKLKSDIQKLDLGNEYQMSKNQIEAFKAGNIKEVSRLASQQEQQNFNIGKVKYEQEVQKLAASKNYDAIKAAMPAEAGVFFDKIVKQGKPPSSTDKDTMLQMGIKDPSLADTIAKAGGGAISNYFLNPDVRKNARLDVFKKERNIDSFYSRDLGERLGDDKQLDREYLDEANKYYVPDPAYHKDFSQLYPTYRIAALLASDMDKILSDPENLARSDVFKNFETWFNNLFAENDKNRAAKQGQELSDKLKGLNIAEDIKVRFQLFVAEYVKSMSGATVSDAERKMYIDALGDKNDSGQKKAMNLFTVVSKIMGAKVATLRATSGANATHLDMTTAPFAAIVDNIYDHRFKKLGVTDTTTNTTSADDDKDFN